jgi:tRNA threonylcarbamoyladenosine biosynthesis protein TsaB
MTLALALETATADTEVALCDDAGAIAEVAVRRGRRHVESLHTAIERVLADAGATVADLGCIAVDIGPGLFTGLRVGVAAAKMLATARGLPLVTATSLEILAAAAQPLAGPDVQVVPVIDMRRGEVAWQLDGEIELGTPAELTGALARTRPSAGGQFVLVGDGAARYEAVFEVRCAGPALATPPARTLGALALTKLVAGETVDPARCVPLYLREADVAIGWDSRPGGPGSSGRPGRPAN